MSSSGCSHWTSVSSPQGEDDEDDEEEDGEEEEEDEEDEEEGGRRGIGRLQNRRGGLAGDVAGEDDDETQLTGLAAKSKWMSLHYCGSLHYLVSRLYKS